MQTRTKRLLARLVAVTPQSPAAIVLLAIVVIALVGIADYYTGFRLLLSVFYFIPILVVSWFAGFRYGVLCSIMAAGVWIGEEILWQRGLSMIEWIWNPISRMTIFISASWMLDRLHQMARDQLREVEEKSNMRIAHILENINEVFFAVDTEWRFTYLNPRAEDFLAKLNRTKEELIGKNLWQEFPAPPDSTGYRLLHKAMADQVPVTYETYYSPIDTWFEIHAYPFPEGLSAYVRDITSRKRTEEELRDQYNEISAMQRLSSALILSPRLRWRLQTGLHMVVEETGFDAGCIYLVDTTRREAILQHAEGFPDPIPESLKRYELGTGITGRVALEGSARFLDESARDNTLVDTPHIPENLGGGFASIPLLSSKGKIVGVFNLMSKKPYVFTEQRRSVLETFGNQIGIAVENAQLYEAARERALKIQQLSLELARVQEEERKYFARELHDGLSQTLTTLKLTAELSLHHFSDDAEKGRWFLKEVIELADEAQAEAKEIASDLRPSVLDDFGIKSAISLLVKKFQRRTGITTELESGVDGVRFESLVESTIYRVVQELLTNVAKHSGATEVRIQLIAQNSAMLITVMDNGKGIQPKTGQAADAVLGGHGLRNIRERLEMLGGTVRVESTQGSGTKVIVQIPLEQRQGEQQTSKSS